MVSLNKVMLIGRVGTTPEMRYTPSGTPVVQFRMAVSRYYTANDGTKQQETDWFTVVVWNKLAEQCNRFLTKGRLVYVEGRLHTRSWESEGKMNYRTDVIANTVTFLDRTENGEGGRPSDVMEDDGTLDITSFDDGGVIELD